LEQVIDASTWKAAASIGREDLGSLRVGAVGDAAVLDLEEGEFAYDDRAGNVLRCGRRFVPLLTIKDGRRWRKPVVLP